MPASATTAPGAAGDRDRVTGSWGYDWLWGEEGAGDLVTGGGGRDRMSGGPGARDIVSFASDSPGAEGVWVALADDRAGTFDGRQLPERDPRTSRT